MNNFSTHNTGSIKTELETNELKARLQKPGH